MGLLGRFYTFVFGFRSWIRKCMAISVLVWQKRRRRFYDSVPYLIMMIFAGLPICYYMELVLGQFSALTPHLMFQRMCPVFTGIGFAMITISFFSSVYYNMVIAWSLYYFYRSFASPLPWSTCGNTWNSEHCFDDKIARDCSDESTYFIGKCINSTQINNTYRQHSNYALGISSGIEEIGSPKWDLVLSLGIAWIVIFLCLSKGIETSGKVQKIQILIFIEKSIFGRLLHRNRAAASFAIYFANSWSDAGKFS